MGKVYFADYLSDDEETNDIIYKDLGLNKKWMERFKKVNLADEEECDDFYNSLQKDYWETHEELLRLNEKNNGIHSNDASYLQLVESANAIEATVEATVLAYLFHIVCIPLELAAMIERNIYAEIWNVPLFWNIKSKTVTFLSCYAVWKGKKEFDFSLMEQVNEEILERLDAIAEEAIQDATQSSHILN